MKSKKPLDFKVAGYHLLFWGFFVLYDIVAWGHFENDYEKSLFTHLIRLPVKMIITYFTIYFIIPKFLFHKKYLLFAISLLTTLVASGVLDNILQNEFIFPKYFPDMPIRSVFYFPLVLINISGNLPTLSILSIFVIMRHWFNLQHAAQSMEKEKLAAELKFLKSQVNPHFLFNTLNNLYALTLKNAKETPQMVLRLSGLLSYMLYESAEPFVSLEKEIKNIKDYVAIEQLRYGKRLEVTINIKGSLSRVKVAPLLILPLVENCFKHGISKELEEGWIIIDLIVKGQHIALKIENSITESKSEEPFGAPGSGIGLKNVLRRLDLIYKDQYDFKILKETESFFVSLKLPMENFEFGEKAMPN